MLEENKKLSHCIERIKVRAFKCDYIYKFSTSQCLENVDSFAYFGIEDYIVKQQLIEQLLMKFKHSLNSVMFGDSVGYEFVKHIEITKNNK